MLIWKALSKCNVSHSKYVHTICIVYSISISLFLSCSLFFSSFQFNALSFILIYALSTVCTHWSSSDPKEISNLKYIFITITQLPNFNVFSPRFAAWTPDSLLWFILSVFIDLFVRSFVCCMCVCVCLSVRRDCRCVFIMKLLI